MGTEADPASLSKREPAEAESAPRTEDFGRHIRDARQARGLTGERLAELTGLSRSYLSNIERDVNSPTISTLRVILDALGMSLSELFRNVEAEQRVLTRPDQRVEIARTGNDAVRYELLNPNPSGKSELILMTVAADGSSGARPHTHIGEEVGLLLEGTLDYWVGDTHHRLEPGDSLSFTSSTPHRYANPGEVPAVSVWCVTPPSF